VGAGLPLGPQPHEWPASFAWWASFNSDIIEDADLFQFIALYAEFGWLPLACAITIAGVAALCVLVHALIIAPILGSVPINQLLAIGTGYRSFLQSFATHPPVWHQIPQSRLAPAEIGFQNEQSRIDLRPRCPSRYRQYAQCFASHPMTVLHRKHCLDNFFPWATLSDWSFALNHLLWNAASFSSLCIDLNQPKFVIFDLVDVSPTLLLVLTRWVEWYILLQRMSPVLTDIVAKVFLHCWSKILRAVDATFV
jgi:hypothetical protein